MLLGILRTLEIKSTHKISAFSFYIVGLTSSIILSEFLDKQLWGVWMGWLLGLLVALIFEIQYFRSLDWGDSFDIVRDKYKIL